MRKLTIDASLDIKGWMSVEELVFLAKCASDSTVKILAEVGSYYGRSARTLADNMNDDAVLYCIDPWSGPVYDNDGKKAYNVNNYVYNTFKENLASYIVKSKVIPLRAKFENVITSLSSVDFIFLDADHRYDAIKNDIQLAWKIVKKGGIIAGHDYDDMWPGVKKAVDEFFPVCERVGSIWLTRKLSSAYQPQNLQDERISMTT